jgi:hypothetical protein
MTDRAPVELTNLDRHGVPPLPWSRPRDLASNPAGTVSVRLQGIDFRFHTAFGRHRRAVRRDPLALRPLSGPLGAPDRPAARKRRTLLEDALGSFLPQAIRRRS